MPYLPSLCRSLLPCLGLLGLTGPAVAAFTNAPLAGEWFFWPRYTLPLRADNYPGPRLPYPTTIHRDLEIESRPLVYHGEQPTERVNRLLQEGELPSGPFTVELWLVNHVNQPVGSLVTARTVADERRPAWAVGYHREDLLFALQPAPGAALVELRAKPGEGWKKYWHHVVAVQRGGHLELFHNGTRVAVQSGLHLADRPVGDQLEAAAYVGREPHMDLGNLLRELRIYRGALTPEQIRERLTELQTRVEAGVIYPALFHFTAGPYLNLVTTNSIRLLWETDRPSTGSIAYGTRLPLTQSIDLSQPKRIHEAELTGLAEATPYFYEVRLTDERGTNISSGTLTFQTGVGPDSAWSFSVIGDTEARPHINDVVAKAVWGERPNFLINVGDLTDGGQHHHKFEWNFEYFLGMNQLVSRVPVFPVPGNGESDLHWYTRYHALPLPENYYSFRYANAEFFMLDSNRPMGPGSEQYTWLEQRLKASTATWKIACHHHPTYTSDEDDYGNTWREPSDLGDLKVRSIVPLYEQYGVDLVFFGHLHSYERTWPIAEGRVNWQRGVRYIQTGGAGGNLENAAPTRNWFTTQLYRGHHYCVLNVYQGRLTFKMHDLEGRLRDAFELTKETDSESR
jgi:acid phosphatase type 7